MFHAGKFIGECNCMAFGDSVAVDWLFMCYDCMALFQARPLLEPTARLSVKSASAILKTNSSLLPGASENTSAATPTTARRHLSLRRQLGYIAVRKPALNSQPGPACRRAGTRRNNHSSIWSPVTFLFPVLTYKKSCFLACLRLRGVQFHLLSVWKTVSGGEKCEHNRGNHVVEIRENEVRSLPVYPQWFRHGPWGGMSLDLSIATDSMVANWMWMVVVAL